VQVVLRKDVDSLGLRGEVVNVARGYARNYLLPRGLAEPATPGLVAELARREAQHARHQARNAEEAQAIAARLEAAELRFEVKAGPTGSLFGSVTATSVADMLWETQKLRIDRRKLELAPIKRIGRYTAPIEVFNCRDGQVFLGVLLDSHWRVLARLMGHPELGDHPDFATAASRVANRAESNRLVAEWCAGGRVDEIMAACVEAGIPASPVRSYADAARDPHVRERDMLQDIAQEDGRSVPITGPAAKFSRTPTRVRTRAAKLGEHTQEILADLGLDSAARRRLRDNKVI